MELSQYVEALQQELTAAAAAGTDEARRVAGLLAATLGSSIRLVIMDVLSQAADEITAALPEGTVEVRLRGRDPQIVVSQAEPAPEPAPESPQEPAAPDTDAGTVRVTLRLPESLKNAVEAAAGQASLSVNSWLVRAVKQSLDQPARRAVGRRLSGYARA